MTLCQMSTILSHKQVNPLSDKQYVLHGSGASNLLGIKDIIFISFVKITNVVCVVKHSCCCIVCVYSNVNACSLLQYIITKAWLETVTSHYETKKG